MTGNDEVAFLVDAALQGDHRAWDELVERYMPLVGSVLRRYRISGDDASDVSQTTWLRLVEHLGDIRDPNALPGWIVTTAKNEAFRLLNGRKRTIAMDPLEDWKTRADPAPDVDARLLSHERHLALLEGIEQLRPGYRTLLLLLLADPPLSYDQIGERLGIPRGSIGPTRARALAELRGTPALRAFLDSYRSAKEK